MRLPAFVVGTHCQHDDELVVDPMRALPDDQHKAVLYLQVNTMLMDLDNDLDGTKAVDTIEILNGHFHRNNVQSKSGFTQKHGLHNKRMRATGWQHHKCVSYVIYFRFRNVEFIYVIQLPAAAYDIDKLEDGVLSGDQLNVLLAATHVMVGELDNPNERFDWFGAIRNITHF